MRARNSVQGLVVVVLAAPLVVGLVGATPALADGTIGSPPSKQGRPYTGSTVDIRANVSSARATDLTLTDPVDTAQPVVVDTSSAPAVMDPLSFPLHTGCWRRSKTCTGVAPAPNGTWTVTVTDTTGSKGQRRTFVLAVPPATPAGFSARGSGSRQVTFNWTKGAEPDLTSYTLYDGAGKVLRDGISKSDACHGSSCSYILTYPADAPGRHDFALTSHRSTSPTPGSTTLASPARATASAALASPSAARPTVAAGPSQGAAGSGPNGPGSPGSSGATVVLPPGDSGAGRALGQTLSAFAPNLALAQLPALPDTPGPTLAEAPLPLGTYKPELPYKPVVAQDPISAAGPVQRAAHTAAAALDTGQLLRSLAGALVLLLAGAHLRRLLSSPVE
jgi:hypothetical protein